MYSAFSRGKSFAIPDGNLRRSHAAAVAATGGESTGEPPADSHCCAVAILEAIYVGRSKGLVLEKSVELTKQLSDRVDNRDPDLAYTTVQSAGRLLDSYVSGFRWLNIIFDSMIQRGGHDSLLTYLLSSTAKPGVYLVRGNQHWFTVDIEKDDNPQDTPQDHPQDNDHPPRTISDAVSRCSLTRAEVLRRGWVFTKGVKLVGRNRSKKRKQRT